MMDDWERCGREWAQLAETWAGEKQNPRRFVYPNPEVTVQVQVEATPIPSPERPGKRVPGTPDWLRVIDGGRE
jgi:hypothetical protein